MYKDKSLLLVCFCRHIMIECQSISYVMCYTPVTEARGLLVVAKIGLHMHLYVLSIPAGEWTQGQYNAV